MSAARRSAAVARATRVEAWVQLALMLAVGATAACASWSHVLSLAERHGQHGWLAWAVAACTETAAVAAGLEVRRRHRTGQASALPVVVLVLATVLQLAAQVAEAERSVWGVVLAAVPAVTFLVLVKLAMSRGGDVAAPAVSAAVSPAAERSPARAVRPPAPTAPAASPVPQPVPTGPTGVPTGERPRPDVGDLLLPGQAIAADLARTGERLTRARLVDELRARGHSCSTARAGALLEALRSAA
ncbi:DUF2637 domain-containing protein [Kineosporia sp. A_224]|uniref:DUF2637 domain-containing protein n=1 Tax=Kineosporia sp. A_224 TaxID=1962180 RepID=UPI001179F5A2|nr:DUF2637 domain-containing protein [Kineosporia sp. A_224]